MFSPSEASIYKRCVSVSEVAHLHVSPAGPLAPAECPRVQMKTAPIEQAPAPPETEL